MWASSNVVLKLFPQHAPYIEVFSIIIIIIIIIIITLLLKL
jgi:hypothetical protein